MPWQLPGGRSLPDLARFAPSRPVDSRRPGPPRRSPRWPTSAPGETSVFAVRTVDVAGRFAASLQAEVRAALRPELGRSLLRVNGSVIARAVADLPTWSRFAFDRDFPHTLRVVVRARTGRAGRPARPGGRGVSRRGERARPACDGTSAAVVAAAAVGDARGRRDRRREPGTDRRSSSEGGRGRGGRAAPDRRSGDRASGRAS